MLTLILLGFIAGGIYLLMRLSQSDEAATEAQQPEGTGTQTDIQATPVVELPTVLTVQKMDAAKLNALGFVTEKMIDREIVNSFVREGQHQL